MSNAISPDSYDPIDAALRRVAEELSRLPNWYEPVRNLTPASSDEARLAVYQAICDEGSLTEGEGRFLVAFTIDLITARLSGLEHQPFANRLARLAKEFDQGQCWHSQADERLSQDDLPRELAVWRRSLVEQLLAHCESMLADSLCKHPRGLCNRMSGGLRLFFGPPDPEVARLRGLTQGLFDEVSACVTTDIPPLVPLRRKWRLEQDMINVEISPTSIEICGGSADGALVDGEMEFNLERLRDLFAGKSRLALPQLSIRVTMPVEYWSTPPIFRVAASSTIGDSVSVDRGGDCQMNSTPIGRREAAKIVASLVNTLEFATFLGASSPAEVASKKAAEVRRIMLLFPWETAGHEFLSLNVAAERSGDFSLVIDRLRQVAVELWPEVPPLLPGTTNDWEGLLRDYADRVEDALDDGCALALIDPREGRARGFCRDVLAAKGIGAEEIERRISEAETSATNPIVTALVSPTMLDGFDARVQIVDLDDDEAMEKILADERFCPVWFVEMDRVLVRRVTESELLQWR